MKFWRIIFAVILCSAFVAGQTKMVSVGPGISQSDRVAGTITTNASVVSVVTPGWSVATVTISGTYAGVTINFETTDDGTNWYATTCTRTDTPTQEVSEAVTANATRSWDCGVYGTTGFRVRASAYSSGTGNIGITLSGANIEPSPTVSGTMTLGAGTAIVGKVGIDQTTPGTTNGVQVNAALPAGTNVIGHVIADTGSTTAVTSATATGFNAQVQGSVASGSTAADRPIQIGAIDQSGNVRNIVETSAGALAIAAAATPGNATANTVAMIGTTGGSHFPVAVFPYYKNAAGTWDTTTGDIKGINIHGTTLGVSCVAATSTATGVTAFGGSCAAPGAGLSIYITDITISASAAGIAADAFPTIKYGTGGTCGTATGVAFGVLSATAIVGYQANFSTPIKIPANNEVCWISSTAGSKFLVINGFIAP